jgi:hypothetical protein
VRIAAEEADKLSFLLLFLLPSHISLCIPSSSQPTCNMNPGVSDSTTNPGEVFTSCLSFLLTETGFGRSWIPSSTCSPVSYQARLAQFSQPRPGLFDRVLTSRDRIQSPSELKRTFSDVDTTDTTDTTDNTDAEQPIPKKACPDRSWHPLFKENPKAILLSNDDIHFCVDRDILSSYRYIPLYLSLLLFDSHAGLTQPELQLY